MITGFKVLLKSLFAHKSTLFKVHLARCEIEHSLKCQEIQECMPAPTRHCTKLSIWQNWLVVTWQLNNSVKTRVGVRVDVVGSWTPTCECLYITLHDLAKMCSICWRIKNNMGTRYWLFLGVYNIRIFLVTWDMQIFPSLRLTSLIVPFIILGIWTPILRRTDMHVGNKATQM